MSKYEESRADAFRTCVIDPGRAKAHFRLAECHFNLGHTAHAIVILEEGILI